MTTPADITEFIAFWRDSTLKERSGSQGHFIALCGLLGIKSPTEADPHGDWFAFEKGAKKTGGGDGWADVWRRRCGSCSSPCTEQRLVQWQASLPA